MVRLHSDENISTLLGASQGPLELRVVSTQLAGQTVRLNAAKCTIGSGSRCTLRLQARRVEPVHCVILRGENGTVIRRWSPHTRLNGATFTDALLQAGDRLTIGPIELDVVSTGQRTDARIPTSAAAPTDPSVAQASISAINAQLLEELNEREAALKAREESLSEQLADLEAQKSAWEKTHKEHQTELAARREEHDALTHELNNLRQLKQDLPDLLEDRQQYDDRISQIASSSKELAAAQAKFEADQTAQETALAARRRELDEQATSLDQARQELVEERAELAKKQEAAESSVHERETELNRRLDEMEATRVAAEKASVEQAKDLRQREQIWQNSQTAWAAERAEWNSTCHETSTEFQRQQSELERQRKVLAEEREELDRQREALAAQAASVAELAELLNSEDPTELEHKGSHAAASTDEIAHTSGEHPSIVSLFDAEQEEACDEEAFESPTSAAHASSLEENLHLHDEVAEEEPAEVEPEHSDLESEDAPIAHDNSTEESSSPEEERVLTLAERLLGRHLPVEPAIDADAESESHRHSEEDHYSAEPEAPAFEEVPKASPAESSGFMERLRAMAQWEDEDESDEKPANLRPSTPGRLPFEPISPLAPSPAKSELGSRQPLGGSAAKGDDEEESIEDYMAKLMSRVRGDSPPIAPVPLVRKVVPEPEPAVEAEPEIPTAEQIKAANTPIEPFEMPQRQVPTELTSNLAAMRELANFSARDAIDTSVRNRWCQAAIGKFSVAGVALLSAGALLYWTKDPRSIQFLGAGIAVLVSVFWGLQGAIMLRNVRQANQVLAEKAKEPAEEAAKMREMLYADTEDLQFDPNKPLAAAALTGSALDPSDDIVEIDGQTESENARGEQLP